MDMFKEYGITKEEYLNNNFIVWGTDFCDGSKESCAECKKILDDRMKKDGYTLNEFVK